MEIQQLIELEIKRAITRHLVQHVKTDDPRCRIDILSEEAAKNILTIIENK